MKSFSEYSIFLVGIRKYGYNSEFRKEYDYELDEICDKWDVPRKYLKTL